MNRIRELRKKLDLTQKELAQHLQIADSTLSYWEMGKYEPDIDSLKKLSMFFNVSIDYIVDGYFNELPPTQIETNYEDDPESQNEIVVSIVSEANSKYDGTSPSESNADSLTEHSPQTEVDHNLSAFHRSEFEDLTKTEIEKLAEYAEFLKSIRKKQDNP
ncbi:MAG: helix-turn-helix domain-containing protein [Oscillospiraceae bacterium]|nr:helix-turn-helix domain-containing protein [Oscillospiraceae bacterium]